MRIVLCYPVEPQHIARIQAAWPEAEIIDAGQERVADELLDADIFCGHPKVPVPWDETVRRRRLLWIQSSAAGLDHCLVPSVVAADITVTSASGVLANQVADHTIALLAGVLRSFPTFFQRSRNANSPAAPRATCTAPASASSASAATAAASPECSNHSKPRSSPPTGSPIRSRRTSTKCCPPTPSTRSCPDIDILILAAPLTSHTRNMIDARRLRLLPHDAVLINVARGPMVVEQDLVDVLASGHLWGAGVDVTEPEPLAVESPLWTSPT